MQYLQLRSFLSPGDILTLTAAVESLHTVFPNEYITDVQTSVPEIWEQNPYIKKIPPDKINKEAIINCEYPSIHCSDSHALSFINGYTHHLGQQLNINLPCVTNRPCLYLSQEEKSWVNQVREHVSSGKDIPFWLINAGIKQDFTCKAWPLEYYQEVVDETRGKIQWVQIGAKEHEHSKLTGVIDFLGKTNHRQLIRLCYHASGGLGPVTYLQHLCAAWEKPYICLVGGREPVTWIQYPKQHTLHTIGQLNCCKDKACWKSRVVPLKDGGNDFSLCEQPVFSFSRPVPKCMSIIKPAEVLAILERQNG